MSDDGLKVGGLAGAGIGAILGGIVVGILVAVSAPVTVPVGALIVIGVAAVGAIAGSSTGK